MPRCPEQRNVSESAQIWLSGAGVSEETVRAGSGPEGNGAGIDPTAGALAMAAASRARVDAFLKDQQALIAAQRHHLAVNRSHLALAKIAEAEKYPPNRGRLRRKWRGSIERQYRVSDNARTDLS